ncbi:sulfotransferase family protein [Bradyrhizobium sp.]|uniref:sulfotransferase family protein n=1 Tax=Bradyrhizobium sp. TaxID=376 RepID=UPI002C37C30E|nr:sulfotransferase [Bradyrhizobium sp.]HMM88271.1 sulfotransferase [Bradyrhizobium sp.]
MLPNFLIVGAARSGTTTVYSHLKDHPDVYLPVNKRPEPHFFFKSAEYAQGLGYYEERFFSAWRGQRAVGEASTSYLFGPDVPRRIRGSLPDARFICILRDPVERAFSNYWHTVKSGLETLSFDDAIVREAERKNEIAGTALGELAPFAYAERGLYHLQLSRWLEEFDRSQLKIVIFDDFVADPGGTLREIASFLDISPDGLPNRAVEVENRSVPEDQRMLPATREMLLETFSEDVTALGRLLGRDLGHWLRA